MRQSSESQSQLSDADIQKGNRVLILRNALGLTQTEFGQKLMRAGKPVSQNYLSAIEQGRKKLGDDVQSRIEARFNVRQQWLEYGIGEMIQEGAIVPTTEQQLRVKSALQNIPAIKPRSTGNLVWVSARDRGAFLRTDGDSATLPRTSFPPYRESIWAFEVTELSMLPNYPPGCWIVASRLVNPHDMVSGVVYGIQTINQFVLAQFIGVNEGLCQFQFTSSSNSLTVNPDSIRHAYHIEFRVAKP
jgi:transcriptional regulator with XRE-family HTH domain